MADRIAFDEVRRQLVDDCGDHRVEIRDLVMQLEVSTGERFEADAIGGFNIPKRGKVRPPGGQRANRPDETV
jgi:hypothetical protein